LGGIISVFFFTVHFLLLFDECHRGVAEAVIMPMAAIAIAVLSVMMATTVIVIAATTTTVPTIRASDAISRTSFIV
jgi:hypothetical protein